ncbi:MAG: hypothetical protein RIS86_1665, partial [Planctomycetota bacterium]
AGRAELHARVMSRYATPLRAYVLGSSLRSLDDPDALVNGFFVTRLGREGYLASWRTSGLALRRWLVNGLLLHARERQRELRKAARDGATGAAPPTGGCGNCGCGSVCQGVGAADEEAALEPAAFEEFERAWARALLSDACDVAQQELAAEGDGDAWEVFRRHNLDGLEYADIALQLRIAPAEARTRSRRASYRFERALRRLLADEGVAADDLDDELAWLLEVSGR